MHLALVRFIGNSSLAGEIIGCWPRRSDRHMPERNNPEERESTKAEQSSSVTPVEDIATAAIEALPSEGAKKDIVAAAINSLPTDAYDAKTKIVSTALES